MAGSVGFALLVYLLHLGARPLKTVGTLEMTIYVVEGVVFLVEGDDVLDRYVVRLRRGRAAAQEQERRYECFQANQKPTYLVPLPRFRFSSDRRTGTSFTSSNTRYTLSQQPVNT